MQVELHTFAASILSDQLDPSLKINHRPKQNHRSKEIMPLVCRLTKTVSLHKLPVRILLNNKSSRSFVRSFVRPFAHAKFIAQPARFRMPLK
jgi:hypothetical protein